MKTIIEKIIKLRNKQFKFDETITNSMLFSFMLQQLLALVRGCKTMLVLKNPKLMLRGKNVSFNNIQKINWGKFLKLGDSVYMNALGTGNITLGNNVSVGAYSRIVISTSLNNLGSHITLGNNVGIGEFAYLGGAGGLNINEDCIIGQYFSCHPENHNYQNNQELIRHQGVSRKGITIGSNCWIGSKVTILDGVEIGNGCVIAAGAVVTKSFPANTVIGGVPAKCITAKKGCILHHSIKATA
jgi:acetyltransferase-like isoleucine patch superfamily enzyme